MRLWGLTVLAVNAAVFIILAVKARYTMRYGSTNVRADEMFAIGLIAVAMGFNLVWAGWFFFRRFAGTRAGRMFGLWLDAKERELQARATDDGQEPRKPS